MATVQRKAPATTTTTTTTTASAKTNGGSTATITTTLAAGAVAQRAYEIWKESGCPNGRDQEHWFRAERELRSKSTLR